MQDEEEKKWVCGHCGYTFSGKFEGDICPQCGLTYWKCARCRYLVTAEKPPDVCPECGEKCDSRFSEFYPNPCYTAGNLQ